MKKIINVTLDTRNAPVGYGPIEYYDWVEKELIKAGVPFIDGSPDGVLSQKLDPHNWGVTIWTFKPIKS